MMALVEKPDPRKKLMLAGVVDGAFVLGGVAAFIATGNMMWPIGAIVAGAAVTAPMLISALRELKEQQDASR